MRSRRDAAAGARVGQFAAFAIGMTSALFAMWPTAARAEAPPGRKPDTTFGRIDGDLSFSVGAGVVVAPRAPRADLDLRLRYLETAGLFFTYEDGAIFGGSAAPEQVLAFGTELRPLFLGRWLTGNELSRSRLDLFIDSFSLELGAAFVKPAGSPFQGSPCLQAGIGIELPLFGEATGLWLALHAGARWSEGAIEGAPITSVDQRATFLAITLAWQEVFSSHVVDEGDRAPR